MHKTLAGALTAALVLSGVRIGFAVEHPSPGGSAQAAPELRPQSAALDVGTATAVATATTPPTALPAPTAAAPNEVPTVASTPGTISVAGGGGIIRLGPLIGSGAEPTFAVQILGIYDIFLAGRPYPFRVQGQSGADTAGRNSPQMLRLSVPAGHTISITTRGATAQTPSARLARDANGFIESTFLGGSAEPAATRTGLSSIVAPADSLVGVFLSNRPPGGKVPATLDFTGSAARNAIVVRPALGQVFFVGRGITNKGTRKRFITPAGATRLFLGSFDHLGSNHDNKGAIVVNITGIAPASNPYQPLPTSTATPVPPTITQTPAATASPFPSDTVTSTPLPTSTPIPTDTPIPTVTITSTPTFTATPSLTATPTLTPTPTVTQTSTPVPTTTPFKFPGT